MQKSIIAGLLVIALIASTIPSVRAEPITLTTLAIVGVTTLMTFASVDMAVHKGDADRAVRKSDDRAESNMQAADATPDATSNQARAEKAKQPVVQ